MNTCCLSRIQIHKTTYPFNNYDGGCGGDNAVTFVEKSNVINAGAVYALCFPNFFNASRRLNMTSFFCLTIFFFFISYPYVSMLIKVTEHCAEYTYFGSGLNLCFVGRISDSVIRQDHVILLGYAALTQPTNITYKQQVSPTTLISA